MLQNIRHHIQKHPLLCIILFGFLLRIAFIQSIPLLADEPLYAVMIEEQLSSPTINPTFLGYEVGWKPPVFFWIYAFFAALLKPLPIPIEMVYRIPTVIFGLINITLVHYILKKLIPEKKIVIFTTLLYASIFLVVHVDGKVLTDTLAMTFILASIFSYLKSEENRKWFLLAGIFGFLAVFIKLALAIMAPLIAGIYFFQKNKKILRSPGFILSVLLIPLALFINYSLFENKAQASDLYLDMIENKILYNLQIGKLIGSFFPFFVLTSVWTIISFLGFFKHWKKNLVLSFWYLLSIFPLIGGFYMPWYFMPVMPAISYFAVCGLIYDKEKINSDLFFKTIFAIFIISGIIIGNLYLEDIGSRNYKYKEIGEEIAFKENVLIIGRYNSPIFGYKILLETRELGKPHDFGWVARLGKTPPDIALVYIDDYYAEPEDVVQGSFARIFFDGYAYRKDTELQSFDHIVLVQVENVTSDSLPFENSVLYQDLDVILVRVD